jgi:hypothetical protein
LVEAVIVAASLVLLCAGITFIHAYAMYEVRATDEARERVWRNAMTECNQPEPLLRELANDLIHGDFPIPDNIVPTALEETASFRTEGLFGRTMVSGSKSISFVCNPRPSTSDPLTSPNEWVLGLFL